MEHAVSVKKRLKRSTVNKYAFLALLFAVPFANFIVFWLYLNGAAFDLAFKIQLADRSVVYSLNNFRALFISMTVKGSTFWIALRNTALYWVTMSILAYLLALLVAFFLFKRTPGYKIYRFIFYVPSLVSATILVVLFKQLIAANGPMGAVFTMFGKEIPAFLADARYAIWACLFYSVFFGFGANLLIINGAMSQVDASLIDAARIDGAGLFTEMFRIVIPIIWPAVSAMLITSVAGFFNASGPILLLTGGNHNTRTIAFWIYEQVYMNTTFYYPAAIGLFFAVVGFPLVLFTRWFLKRSVASADREEGRA